MPAYNNPYYGPTYGQVSYNGGYVPQQSYTPIQMPAQQSYTPAPVQQPKVMEWVEGEIGAKAFQMPAGWPANTPIPLWDSTDTVIYLKSWSPMGIPNPMQKLRYEMPEQQNQALLSGSVGNGQSGNLDMSQYVTKQDFDQLRNEIRQMNQGGANVGQNNSGNNQNGSNPGQNGGNRGGNR